MGNKLRVVEEIKYLLQRSWKEAKECPSTEAESTSCWHLYEALSHRQHLLMLWPLSSHFRHPRCATCLPECHRYGRNVTPLTSFPQRYFWHSDLDGLDSQCHGAQMSEWNSCSGPHKDVLPVFSEAHSSHLSHPTTSDYGRKCFHMSWTIEERCLHRFHSLQKWR